LATTATTGYLPIRILNKTVAHEQKASLHSLDVGQPPSATLLLWIAITLAGLVHALASRFSWAVPSRLRDEFDFSDDGDSITAAKAFCHGTALTVIALAGWIAGSSFLYFAGAPYRIHPFGFAIRVYLALTGLV